jgi:AcrR family transcriptional regulator
VNAGAELVRASSIRDWHGVTIRAVAARAGVNERTVYRHFANERALRDAVMRRFEEEAGVELATMRLDQVADVAARIVNHVSAYPPAPRPPLDSTLVDANQRMHDALLEAVAADTAEWPAADQRVAAAVLDVMWAVGTYERLAVDWELDPDEATRALRWMISLIESAIRTNNPPPRA